jgi:hypothetical protein
MARGPGKGKSNNPSGRPKGIKNKKVQEWEALGEAITGELTGKLKEELEKLEGKDYINALASILQYFKPKMAATTIDGKVEIPNVVVEIKPKD